MAFVKIWGRGFIEIMVSTENFIDNRRLLAFGASVATEIDLFIVPLWVGLVWTLATSLPDRPAGITESNSATVHPQEGLALMILTSLSVSL